MRDDLALLKSVTGQPMALEGVTARGTVRGLLFELKVEQRYRNPGAENIEAVYTFPLPFEAVLLDLDIALGGRKLSAVVVEKQEAQGRYEQAIDEGDTAIMLERAGDGLCTLNLGNLMAGETAVIRYRYAQLLRFEHGSVRLAVPTVIAPRYGDPADAGLAPHQVPSTDLRAAYPFSLTLDLHGDIATGTLSSPSHAIATERTENGVRVSLARGAFLDRDFVLNVGGLRGRQLAVVARDGERFVALASFCADLPHAAEALALRVKLLVDCSGSMSGDSIEAARRALHRILAGLAPADRFAFSRFGSQVVHETKGLVAADRANVRAAAERLGRMHADLGGTEMPAALRSTFALGGAGAAADVLLITDGEVWNSEGLLAEARAAKQRVFVVGIGSAPAEGVLKRLADSSGGACEFVAPNEDAEGAILRMFARLRAPRIERAEVAWPSKPAWTTQLPNALFGGETVHAFAGFDAAPAGVATLKLSPRNDGAPMTAKVSLTSTLLVDRTLSRVAASRRIETASEAKQLRLALDYGLLTARTNLIVVLERADGEKAKDLPALAAVAQMHAAGWHGVGSVLETVSSEVVCMHALTVDFGFDKRGSFLAPKRRVATREFSQRVLLDDTDFDHLDFDASDRPDARLQELASPLAQVLAALERTASQRSPASLEDLAAAGLPKRVVDLLADLVAAGHDERDVVRAVLEALGNLLADGAIRARVSRHFARTLRRQFTGREEHRELRARVLQIARNSCGSLETVGSPR